MLHAFIVRVVVRVVVLHAIVVQVVVLQIVVRQAAVYRSLCDKLLCCYSLYGGTTSGPKSLRRSLTPINFRISIGRFIHTEETSFGWGLFLGLLFLGFGVPFAKPAAKLLR